MSLPVPDEPPSLLDWEKEFARQFRWEGQQFLFRHRGEGGGIACSEADAVALCLAHAARRRAGNRLIGMAVSLSLLTIYVSIFYRPYLPRFLWDWGGFEIGFLFAGLFVSLPAVEWWSYQVTADLRRRPVVARRVGSFEAWARKMEDIPWLAFITCWLMMAPVVPFGIWLVVTDDRPERWIMAGLLACATIFMVVATAIKVIGYRCDRAKATSEAARRLGPAQGSPGAPGPVN